VFRVCIHIVFSTVINQFGFHGW